MTSPQSDQQAGQAELERTVTRVAQRAADNVARQLADLGTQLAFAQESLEGIAVVNAQQREQIAEKDAELARAHQATADLRARVAELEGEQQTPTLPEAPAS